MSTAVCERTGKTQYPSKAAAAKAAAGINNRVPGRNRSTPYLCRACGTWHIGRVK